MAERITGDLGRRMVDRALEALMPRDGIFSGWQGNATDLGVTWPRSIWRSRMRSALEASFDELLREPGTPRAPPPTLVEEG